MIFFAMLHTLVLKLIHCTYKYIVSTMSHCKCNSERRKTSNAAQEFKPARASGRSLSPPLTLSPFLDLTEAHNCFFVFII